MTYLEWKRKYAVLNTNGNYRWYVVDGHRLPDDRRDDRAEDHLRSYYLHVVKPLRFNRFVNIFLAIWGIFLMIATMGEFNDQFVAGLIFVVWASTRMQHEEQ